MLGLIDTTHFILLLVVLSYHMTGQLIPQHRLSAVSSISGGSSDATIASSNTAAIQTSFANVFARPLVPCLGRWATFLLSLRLTLTIGFGYPTSCTTCVRFAYL